MRKTFIRFFTIADFEEEEIWLRKQHLAGWKFVTMHIPCFYVFESCEPADVIYRLDYRHNEQTDDYLAMLRDFGWEYCGNCLGWLYFRKPADQAETEEDLELFSDNQSRVNQVRKIILTRLLPVEGIFLCCVIPNFIRFNSSGSTGTGSMFFSVFFSVMFFLYLFLII